MDNKSQTLINLIIFNKAEQYLQSNPERFTPFEKNKFLLDLKTFLLKKEEAIDDEVFDFLVAENLVDNEPRTNTFIRHLIAKYNCLTTPRVLDIGAGRMCHLSTKLGKRGFNVTAMDPKIRLEDAELEQRKIQTIIKKPFYCDEYGNQGTDISNFDLLVGMEPCDATEHIIRQGLKYDKPFEVSLCYQAHDGLNGKKFKTPEDWYKSLKQISSEVDILKTKNNYIAYHK